VPNAFVLEALHALVEAGVIVVPGTDSQSAGAIAGFALLTELDLMVEAGLTPARALLAATAHAARVALLSDQTGTIAVGYDADLLLLERNPLEGLAGLASPRGVAARGLWYDRATLEQLGRPPYTEEP
jgi:imidazolonepropionase-like amidohydrolase